jgi:hypothetical protein
LAVSSVRNVTRVPGLTNWNSERIAVTTQDAFKSASDSDDTSTVADRFCVAARDDLTITAKCVAIRADSWLISSLISRWHGLGRKGEERIEKIVGTCILMVVCVNIRWYIGTASRTL